MDKPILVMDLDSTLVYSTTSKPDNTLIVHKFGNLNVHLRPYAKEFLIILNKYYTIHVFTAGVEEYAKFVVSVLDKEKNIIKKVFSRKYCKMYGPFIVKDLKIICSDLERCLLIDDTASTSYFQPYNHIHIKAWHGDASDKILYNLISPVIFLSFVKDVKTYTKKINNMLKVMYLV